MAILVITCEEKNERTGKMELIASHGVDMSFGQTVCLPSEHPALLGAKHDPKRGGWILEDIVK